LELVKTKTKSTLLMLRLSQANRQGKYLGLVHDRKLD